MKSCSLLSLLALSIGSAMAAEVTFSEHIAPIVHQNCTNCHRAGEVAPFELVDYESVKRRARTIASVVESRYMPPWHAKEGWGNFQNDLSLTEEQISLILDWVKAGAPEGDSALTPQPPSFPEGWALGTPDLVLEMEEPFSIHAEGDDIYRYFALPLELKEDHWVRAIEVRPEARSVVHHVLFYLDHSGNGRRLDTQDPLPGFDGQGFRGTGSLGGWAVGGRPFLLSGDYARHLPTGSDLVIQTHFHPTGKVEQERTRIGLYFAESPPEKQIIEFQIPPHFGEHSGIDIPPNEEHHELKDQFEVPTDMELLSIWGHAHQLAESMQAIATLPDGSTEKLLRIEDWQFNWQAEYLYEEPVQLPAGSRIDVSIVYNNSESNPNNPWSPPRRVFWGLQSEEEMGSLILQVVAKDAAEEAKLARGIYEEAAKSRQRRQDAARKTDRRRLVLQLDADGDDRLALAETPADSIEIFEQLDLNEDGYLQLNEIDEGGRILDPLLGY